MYLWDKGGKTRKAVIDFTCRRDRALDERLASYDILGSMAHAIMLGKCGIITPAESSSVCEGLMVLYAEAEAGRLTVDEGYEDIHSLVEARLKEIIGETAGKLHTGRSRNDQVLTDIHLWARDSIRDLARRLNDFATRLLSLSEEHNEILMPGFTHMQPAMVSSFGLWFASHAESISDDLLLLSDSVKYVNASPLGTAAGYGSSLPLDRALTASLLRFDRLIVTSPYAQMTRGRTERIITQAIASAANSLGRLASDIILFMSPGFGFVTLNDEFTTGSSIMPQKKNPDIIELVRARCAKLQALPAEVTLMSASLPPGYNRDYQELKGILFNAFDEITELVAVMHMALEGISVNSEIMKDGKFNSIFSVEEANKMVMKGMPFRDAYKAVAGVVGSQSFDTPRFSAYTHTGSIGNTGSGLILEKIQKVMQVFLGLSSPDELFQSIRAALADKTTK